MWLWLHSLLILSLRLLLRKIHLPRQREARHKPIFFIVHRLTFFEPRDYRVVFVIQKIRTHSCTDFLEEPNDLDATFDKSTI